MRATDSVKYQFQESATRGLMVQRSNKECSTGMS